MFDGVEFFWEEDFVVDWLIVKVVLVEVFYGLFDYLVFDEFCE